MTDKLTSLDFLRDNANEADFRAFCEEVRRSLLQSEKDIKDCIRAHTFDQLAQHMHALKNEFAHLGYEDGAKWSIATNLADQTQYFGNGLALLRQHIVTALKMIAAQAIDSSRY